jgi:membrane protein implicated in regulation of membrane protease activity
MSRNTTEHPGVGVTEGSAGALVGAGLVVMALFPLSIPIVGLTLVALLPLVPVALAAGLIAGLVAVPVLLIRGLRRRLRRRSAATPAPSPTIQPGSP